MTSVYIAGLGLVSSMGGNLSEAISNLHQPPKSQPRWIKGLDYTIPYHAISLPKTTWNERCQILIRQAVAEAGQANRTGGLYLASSSVNVGAMEAGETYAESLPDFLTELGAMLDWQGPISWINTACTSSLNALLAAQDAILSGFIEDALIIGLELENQLTLAGFAGMQLLSTDKARPFAAQRNGLVLGEAVAALRLTKQPGRWQLKGGAQVIDSSQISGASTTAYRSMLEQTLKQTQLNPGQIDLIKVQAAGSITNDAVEAQALGDFFASSRPPLISLKPLLGHTLGASGAAEIALLLRLLDEQQWPKIDADIVDAELKVNLAPELPQHTKHILVCNLGFGGSHSCIALENTDL